MLKKRVWIPILLLLFALLSIYPIPFGEVRWAHDLAFHYLRLRGLADAIKHLELTGRVQMYWCNGWGYAVGVCYNHILLWPFAMMYRLWFSLDFAYKTYAILIAFLTAYNAYHAFFRLSGTRRLGLFGSFLYTNAIYRLNNIHTRGDVGEYTAMTFLPLILLGLYELYLNYPETEETAELRKHPVLHLVIGATGIASCHVVTCRAVLVYCIVVVLLAWRKTFTKTVLRMIGKAVGITLLLNLYFLVPLCDYYFSKVITSSANGIWEDIDGSYLSPANMFSISFDTMREGHGLPFMTSLNTIYVLSILLGIVVYVVLRRKKRKAPYLRILLWLTLVTLYLASPWFPANRMEKHLPLLYFIIAGGMQFIWRYICYATLLVIALTIELFAILLQFAKGITDARKRHQYERILAVFAGVVFLSVATQAIQFHYHEQSVSMEAVALDQSTFIMSNAEYLTAGANQWYMREHDEITVSDNSKVTASFISRNGLRITVDVTSTSDEEEFVALPIMNYKGFTARDESGETLPLSSGISDRMQIRVAPRYTGTVFVAFHQPLYWRFADCISIVTLAILLIRSRRRFGL